MKKNDKIKIVTLVLLIPVILASGCVQRAPVEISPNEGLKIVQFTAEPDFVDVNETVLFTIRVQNIGGVIAENVDVWLSGVEGHWRINGRLVGPADNEKRLRNLNPPNPAYNQPGDIDMAYWTFRTPVQPPGLNVTYPVIAWLSYRYYTTGSVIFKVVDEDHYRIAYAARGRTPHGPIVSNTHAPIKILVPDDMTTYYMVIDGDLNATQTRPVQFKLVNVGSGFPVGGGRPGRIFGTIDISGPRVRFRDCLGMRNTTRVTITTANVDYAKLNVARGEAVISCTIEFDRNPGIVDDIVTVSFNLNYEYFGHAETRVTVSSFK